MEAAPVGAAASGLVQCEVPITASVKVRNNLFCADGGLVIGAENITVDLNGHVVQGNTLGSDTGIDNTSGCGGSGCEGAKVKNGVVTGFQHGVHYKDADKAKIESLIVWGNSGFGILLDGWEKGSVSGNTATGNGAGIGLTGTSGVTLKNNFVTDSVSSGIGLSDSTGNKLKKNESIGNAADGMNLSAGSIENKLSGNTIIGNALSGISLLSSADNLVKDNVLKGQGSFGIATDSADDVRLIGNQITASGASGIFVGNDSDRVAIDDNTASANNAEGINVAATSNLAEVTNNTASENGTTGILVSSSDSTVTDNTAFVNGFFGGTNNGGFGISSASADASDNTASANGSPMCNPVTACSSFGVPPSGVLVSCGDDISADTRVLNNLSCTGDGVEICSCGRHTRHGRT